MLKDLAAIVADVCGTRVVFEIPDDIEAAGYSRATKARLANDKIKKLGYHAQFDIHKGIERTITILKEVQVC